MVERYRSATKEATESRRESSSPLYFTTSDQRMQNDHERRQVSARLYTPLRVWETRLINIHPGFPADALVVDLQIAVVTLADGMGLTDSNVMVNFEALSYIWGESVFDHIVQCNGLPFTITANLHQALVHLRRSNEERWIWADGLCINQYDVVEKFLQIRNLFRIFQKGDKVVVWLGEALPCVDMALRFLNEDLKYWLDCFDVTPSESDEDSTCSDDFPDIIPAIFVEVVTQWHGENFSHMSYHDMLQEMAQGFRIVAGRQWFYRAWIIQEVAAASEIVVHCGSNIFAWNRMLLVPQITEELEGELERIVNETKDINSEPLAQFNRQLMHLESARNTATKYWRAEDDNYFYFPATACLRLFNAAITNNVQATISLDRMFALFNITKVPTEPANGEAVDYMKLDYKSTVLDMLVRLCKMAMNEMKSPYLKAMVNFEALDEVVGSRDAIKKLDTAFDPPTWLTTLWSLDAWKPAYYSMHDLPVWTRQDLDDTKKLKIPGKSYGSVHAMRWVENEEDRIEVVWEIKLFDDVDLTMRTTEDKAPWGKSNEPACVSRVERFPTLPQTRSGFLTLFMTDNELIEPAELGDVLISTNRRYWLVRSVPENLNVFNLVSIVEEDVLIGWSSNWTDKRTFELHFGLDYESKSRFKFTLEHFDLV